MPVLIRFATALLATVAFIPAAHAYIGPGMGAGAIAALLGILSSIFLAIFAVVYYPFKRFMKRRRATHKPTETQDRG
jgi:hypothetical protein